MLRGQAEQPVKAQDRNCYATEIQEAFQCRRETWRLTEFGHGSDPLHICGGKGGYPVRQVEDEQSAGFGLRHAGTISHRMVLPAAARKLFDLLV